MALSLYEDWPAFKDLMASFLGSYGQLYKDLMTILGSSRAILGPILTPPTNTTTREAPR